MKKLDLAEEQPQTESQTSPTTAIEETIDEPVLKMDNQPSSETLLKPLDLKKKDSNMNKTSKRLTLVFSLVAIVLGVTTGYGAFKLAPQSAQNNSGSPLQQVAGKEQIVAGDVFGIKDTDTFKDNAEGYLEKGGVDGEGSHKLLRSGGVSQTVYLTSSITDLDKFVGMDVKISGETFKAQTAGWLMDVGRIEIVNVEGEKPLE